jgi:ribosomal protein L40E
LQSNPDGTLTCSFCGNHYAAPGGVLCPACGATNDEGQGYCAQCGYDLIRECLGCGADNPYSATHCQTCGRSLSSLEAMVERLQQGTAGRLEQQMDQAREIKEREQAASQRRQEELWRREYERQQRVNEEQAVQTRQETRTVRLVFTLVIIFILLVVVFIVIRACSGGDAAPSGWQILWSAYA